MAPSNTDIPRGVPYDDALRLVLESGASLAAARALGSEAVPLADSLGRALATSITSRLALPPWDNAGMDGYAVRRADVVGARQATPRVLPVAGSSVAGSDPAILPWVQPGTAMRIMTGAPMPPGADAVIRIEDTDGGVDVVSIVDDRDAEGRGNVRPRGEDIQPGQVMFDAGTTLRAAHLGALASIGVARPIVYRRPRVTVVASGDELVLLDRFPDAEAGTRIVSSSSYALPALLATAGADVTMAPLVPDDLDALTDAVRAAIDGGCDLLITTGGISVGAYDFTRAALEAAGGVQHFWRARIRPGGPLGMGDVAGVPWMGLPGNPVSTLVTGMLFAWPLIRLLGGHRTFRHFTLPVRMRDAVDTPAALTYFLRTSLAVGNDGMIEARLTGAQSSNLLRASASADALLVVPETMSRVEPGTVLQAILLPDGPPLVAASSERPT